MASLSASISQGCDFGSGVLTLSSAQPGAGAGANLTYSWSVRDSQGTEYGGDFDPGQLPLQLTGLPNAGYTARVQAVDNDGGATYYSRLFEFDINCGVPGPGHLVLVSASATDETAALNDGTATITASGGQPPLTALLVDLSMTMPATDGQPSTFTQLPPTAAYTLRVHDSSPTPQVVEAKVTVHPYVAPKDGCQDEYATNYDPQATSGGAASCTYAPKWRAAWQPMAVAVPALAGQTAAYLTALLRIGFRPGHPLAAQRPLGATLELRATVGPDGYATFRLGPYLQAALGEDDGHGGYRLNVNNATALNYDLYVGYELRRVTGELLEHGYALNAAVPDDQLQSVLSPFRVLPVWPGYDGYSVTTRYSTLSGFGLLGIEGADGIGDVRYLPCPSNPLPVRWLAPGGGYGYWVFQGRPVLGDSVGEGQQYREALTGEQRYSDPGDSYQTYKASSGAFGGDDLLAGLRTLWRSPQAWAQLEPGGDWVPILIPRGDRDVAQLGIRRRELVLNFSIATPEWAQGQ